MRRKVKILRLFSICIILAIGSTVVFGQEEVDTLATEDLPLYWEYSECLQDLFREADTTKATLGEEAEINLLIERKAICEQQSPVSRRIALRHLEWGDTTYDDIGSETKSKKELFKEGLSWAKLAIRQDSTDHLNYEIASTAYAAVITVSRLRTKARLADSVRVYAEHAIRLHPQNDRAYHILGRWHYEVSKLGWLTKFLSRVVFREPQDGSFEKAEEYFNKAIELDNISSHRYWLGLAYLEQGKKEEALEQFRIIQTLPNVLHNDDYIKEEAKKLIEKHS